MTTDHTPLLTFERLAVGDVVTLRFEPIWANVEGKTERKHVDSREREYAYRGIDSDGNAHFIAAGAVPPDAVDPDEIVAWYHDEWDRYVTGDGDTRSAMIFSQRSATLEVPVPEDGIASHGLCGSRTPGDLVKLRMSHPDRPTVLGESIAVYCGTETDEHGINDSIVSFTYVGSGYGFKARRPAGRSQYLARGHYVEEAYEEPGEIRP